MLLVLLTTLTIAAGQASAPSDSPAAWQRYAIKGEDLSCELPQAPTTSTIYRPRRNPGANPPEVPRKGVLYGAFNAGVVYLVASYDNSTDAQNVDFFVQEIDRLPISMRRSKFDRDLLIGGINGKQYNFTTPTLAGLMQIYRSKKHIYVIYVVAALGESLNKPDVARFLNSLSFNPQRVNYDPDDAPPSESGASSTTPADSVVIGGVGAGVSSGPGAGGPHAANGKDVSRRAIVVVKPEAGYTEDARREEVTGTVVLRCVFSAAGRVEKITPLKPLPAGLTEKAIAAARNIRFIPALKDGKYVSMYMQLEYNFNLY